MDFVAREILLLFWFSLTLGTFGDITGTAPNNQAVGVGARNVEIKCFSTTDGNLIKWSFTPAGQAKDDSLTNGAVFKDPETYSKVVDGTSSILTISKASFSTAGTYTCTEGGMYSTLLIVLDQKCDYSPNPTNTLPCDSILKLSCTVNCFVTPRYLNNTLQLKWLSEPTIEGLDGEDSSPPTTTTRNSTLEVKWPEVVGAMPIYTCAITINLNKAALLNRMNQEALTFTNTCQPFASASSVPCGEKDDTKKSGEKNSSVRSAETNNLAIRVLSVAGVLLLAQMF